MIAMVTYYVKKETALNQSEASIGVFFSMRIDVAMLAHAGERESLGLCEENAKKIVIRCGMQCKENQVFYKKLECISSTLSFG